MPCHVGGFMDKYKISEDEEFCCRCGTRLHEDTNWKDERQDEDGDYLWCDTCGDAAEADAELNYDMWREEHSDEGDGE